MKTIAIPLDRLRLADTNMRVTGRTAGLEELKASLLVHGQLQPIVVIHAPDGGFGVIAGARRTLAARALVAEGKWPNSARLAAVCRRAGTAEARELSLAENLQRVAPCAADEAMAFARLVDEGIDAAALAARFGRPVRYVRQRLALAALSPAVLDALREGRVPLAVAEALTLAPSPARQEELLAQVLDQRPHDAARYVREALRRTRLSTGHALPGVLEAYEASGGTLTRDLFDGADEGYVDDPALFLAGQRAAVESEAERLRSDWAFVELRDGPDAWNWHGAYVQAVASLTPEQEARVAELEAELERPDFEREERAIVEAELDAIMPDYDRKSCGVVAVLSPDGSVAWIEGLRRRSPAPVALPDSDDDVPPWEDLPVRPAAVPRIGETADEPHLSATVREELSAVRTASFQAAVMADPAMAVRLACFALLAPGNGPCALSGGEAIFPAPVRAHHTSRAWRAVERNTEAWAGRLGLDGSGWTRDPQALWDALGSPAVELPALFALLVARRCRFDHGAGGIGEAAARTMAVSVSAAWRPDAALLERLPKAVLLDAARAIAPGFAATLAGRRKTEMAERVSHCLAAGEDADWPALTGGAVSAPRGNLEAAQRAAMSWLPPGTAIPHPDDELETAPEALAAE